MGRSAIGGNGSRHQQASERNDHDRHGGHRADDGSHGGRGHEREWDRAFDIELQDSHHGLELEIDVDRHGRKLDIEVEFEFGSELELDIDLEIDLGLLQPDQTPMTVVAGGEGNAVGHDTLVDASIFSRLLDLGAVTVAFGSVDFAAIAVADEQLAFASAMTFADIAGADLVFVLTESTSMSSSRGSSSYAREASTTHFVAVDFEAFDFADGPLLLAYDQASQYLAPACSCRCATGERLQLDGNVAQLATDAVTKGENTVVDVLASILTVEDQLSSVSAVAVSAVA